MQSATLSSGWFVCTLLFLLSIPPLCRTIASGHTQPGRCASAVETKLISCRTVVDRRSPPPALPLLLLFAPSWKNSVVRIDCFTLVTFSPISLLFVLRTSLLVLIPLYILRFYFSAVGCHTHTHSLSSSFVVNVMPSRSSHFWFEPSPIRYFTKNSCNICRTHTHTFLV